MQFKSIILYLTAINSFLSCRSQSDEVMLLKNYDTTRSNSIYTIKLTTKILPNSKDSIILIETKSSLLQRNGVETSEKKILKNSLKKYDSLNYINKVSNEDIFLKHCTYFKDTCFVDIYFSSKKGYLNIGEMKIEGNHVILSTKKAIFYEDLYHLDVVAQKISFKIFFRKSKFLNCFYS